MKLLCRSRILLGSWSGRLGLKFGQYYSLSVKNTPKNDRDIGPATRLPRIYSERKEMLDAGTLSSAYPSFKRPYEMTLIAQVVRDYQEKSIFETKKVILGGRISAIREMSSSLTFADMYHDGYRIQLILNSKILDNYSDIIYSLQRGDIVHAKGELTRTSSGELSVLAKTLLICAPCIRNVPALNAPQMTEEHRARWRHLDLIARPEQIEYYRKRSKIIRGMQRFLDDRGFLEVETPILSCKAGGALAKSFTTNLDNLSLPLNLRIAPELFLKQLIAGGFGKVYELGKVFRNEGLDATHNPEFTSLEFYQSFASAEDIKLVAMDLLRTMVMDTCGAEKIVYQGTCIDFSFPFQEVDIVTTLERMLRIKFPLEDSASMIELCQGILKDNSIGYDESRCHVAYLFDKLIGHYLAPLCIQPTFLVNHPLFMSPLARPHSNNPHLSDRFELYVSENELMNGYSELNDPHDQSLRFREQAKLRRRGDHEAHEIDEEFIEVLEVGMPPTAGCGVGIDRLVMLLTDQSHIRNVLLFPLMKPTN